MGTIAAGAWLPRAVGKKNILRTHLIRAIKTPMKRRSLDTPWMLDLCLVKYSKHRRSPAESWYGLPEHLDRGSHPGKLIRQAANVESERD